MTLLREAIERAARVEEILRGKNPSPGKAKAARELAEEHLKHLADLEPRSELDLEGLDND